MNSGELYPKLGRLMCNVDWKQLRYVIVIVIEMEVEEV